MPRKGGLETFRELRRLRPDLPVILSSGYSEQEVIRNFVEEGLAGFLQKPYRLRELKKKILQALALHLSSYAASMNI